MGKQDAGAVTRDVGRKLAELRARAGLTQDKLAERLQIDTNNLQRIELGMQNLTIRTLVRLANGLDVPVAHLFRPPRSRLVRKGRPPKRSKGPPANRSTNGKRSRRKARSTASTKRKQ